MMAPLVRFRAGMFTHGTRLWCCETGNFPRKHTPANFPLSFPTDGEVVRPQATAGHATRECDPMRGGWSMRAGKPRTGRASNSTEIGDGGHVGAVVMACTARPKCSVWPESPVGTAGGRCSGALPQAGP